MSVGPHGGSRQVSVSFPLGVLEVVSTAMIGLGMLCWYLRLMSLCSLDKCNSGLASALAKCTTGESKCPCRFGEAQALDQEGSRRRMRRSRLRRWLCPRLDFSMFDMFWHVLTSFDMLHGTKKINPLQIEAKASSLHAQLHWPWWCRRVSWHHHIIAVKHHKTVKHRHWQGRLEHQESWRFPEKGSPDATDDWVQFNADMIWIPNPMLQGPSNLPSELIFACECQLDKQVGRVGRVGGSGGCGSRKTTNWRHVHSDEGGCHLFW